MTVEAALARADRMWDLVHDRPAGDYSSWGGDMKGLNYWLKGWGVQDNGDYSSWGTNTGVANPLYAAGVAPFLQPAVKGIDVPDAKGSMIGRADAGGNGAYAPPKSGSPAEQRNQLLRQRVLQQYQGVLNDPNTSPLEKETARAVIDAAYGISRQAEDPDQARQQALAYARSLFGEEGARVLNATFETENGWGGAIGDTDRSPVGSYGPLQFFGGGGQLDNFAKEKGFKDLKLAGEYVRTHPLEAVLWALNGYYGAVLRQGLDAGLTGPALAEYVQRNAQRSESPERAAGAYMKLYGPQLARAH